MWFQHLESIGGGQSKHFWGGASLEGGPVKKTPCTRYCSYLTTLLFVLWPMIFSPASISAGRRPPLLLMLTHCQVFTITILSLNRNMGSKLSHTCIPNPYTTYLTIQFHFPSQVVLGQLETILISARIKGVVDVGRWFPEYWYLNFVYQHLLRSVL